MATNEFVTSPVASYMWAEIPPAKNHHAMPVCSNYQSSRLGLKPGQWRASVRVLNPAKAEEQYQTADSTVSVFVASSVQYRFWSEDHGNKKNCHYSSSFPLIGLNSHSRETTMPCQKCSNYRSSRIGLCMYVYIKRKIGVQLDLNLRRQRLAARLSEMVAAKPLGQLIYTYIYSAKTRSLSWYRALNTKVEQQYNRQRRQNRRPY